MFGSVAGGDDRSSFRTLGVGRRILDAGFKSIPVSHVAAVTIYRPSRFGFVKLFFALCCVVAGAMVGLFFFVPPTWSVPIGGAIGLVVGLMAFVPSRPTCLVIAASDGSGAVFESRDIAFLRQCKSFIDAKINESRLDATGFFDFETSRFEPLAENGGRVPAAPVPSPNEAAAASAASSSTRQGVEPVMDAPDVSLPESAVQIHDPSGPGPEVSAPAPAAAAPPEMGAPQEPVLPPQSQPQAPPHDQGVAMQDDGYDALRNALMAAGGTAPEPPIEPAAPPQQPPSQPMPPLDFGNAMAQVQQVRRFYEETVQNPSMVQRLDVMVDIMHSGAGNERDRADLILIAEEIESNLTTYPSIAAIFRRVANQARTGVAA
jgi:hypothetical protein